MRSLASALALTLTFALAACGGDDSSSPTSPDQDEGPTTGAISVTTSTSGATPDPDGYAVAPDGETAVDVGTDSTVVFTDLSEGSYSISLSKVATNCQQDGSASATVTAGDTVSTTVNVECSESIRDRILFSSTRHDSIYDLYTMAHDGSDVQRLTTNADLVAMDVNDAGTRILALGPISTTDDLELHVVQADGSIRQVTNDDLDQFYTSMNPDGSAAIYAGEDTTNSGYSLMRVDLDGGGTPTAVVADSMWSRFPDWSPDGSTVAFSREDSAGVSYDVYTADADGGGLNAVVQDTSTSFYKPTYSPSGDRLAYMSLADSTIVARDLGSGSAQTIASGVVTFEPSLTWLAGGEHLVYQVDDGDLELRRAAADGSGGIPLTNNSFEDGFAAAARWSSGNN